MAHVPRLAAATSMPTSSATDVRTSDWSPAGRGVISQTSPGHHCAAEVGHDGCHERLAERPREGGNVRVDQAGDAGRRLTRSRSAATPHAPEEAGAGAPDGRISHVALETDGEIQVFDVWESQAAFDAFGATLIPILTAAGIELNEPMVARVHNEITG
jgi:hypothetical protein